MILTLFNTGVSGNGYLCRFFLNSMFLIGFKLIYLHKTIENMVVKRICIYPKDIQRITEKSERYGRLLLAKIREQNDKQCHQLVTVDEFCQYTGLSPDQVTPFNAG